MTDQEIIKSLEDIADPSEEQMNLIFLMYKKYVNPNIYTYTTGCTCENNIKNLYRDLMSWAKNNPW